MRHWKHSVSNDHRWLGVNANAEYLINVAEDVDTGDHYVMLEFSTHGAGFHVIIKTEPSLEEAKQAARTWAMNHDPIEPGDLETYFGL